MGRINYVDGTLEELEKQRDTLNNDCRQMQHELDRKGGFRLKTTHLSAMERNAGARGKKSLRRN